jgi:hypothetical protein
MTLWRNDYAFSAPPQMVALKIGEVFRYSGTNSNIERDDYWNDHSDRHICIVVGIDERQRDAYLVPLSTSPVYLDKTCEIDVSDGCPFVTKRCYVAYRHVKKAPLGGAIRDASLSREAPIALLARVVAGVQTSVRTPQWFRDAIFPPAARKMTIHRAGATRAMGDR